MGHIKTDPKDNIPEVTPSISRCGFIYLGPPGSGKGTQAEYLSQYLRLPHIATGDILRQAIAKDNSLGGKVKTFIQQGTLVPDELMIEIISARLRQTDCLNGFILDGFPRTLAQAKALDELLRVIYYPADLPAKDVTAWLADKIKIINLEVPEVVLIERLSGRRVCKGCGTNFHLKYSPPKNPGICDHCRAELFQREDDKPETIKRRLKVYYQETQPLIDYYGGRVINIAADQTIEQVWQQVLLKLKLKA